MKKLFSVLLIIIFSFAVLPTVCAETKQGKQNADAPAVSAEAFVLYCADNNSIICSKDENKRMRPASTTKLITSLITLEQAASSNKKVEFTQDMVSEGSSMYLKVGEVVTLKDLAAGMMMASGNDAANAAAVSIAGSREKFADRMNDCAKRIGMKNTHFVTPSGLDNDEHYSTAYDMALLMDYALENEDFAALTAQKSATVDFVKPESKKITYSNHNRLLSLYKYCVGGKTGYTMAAGRCLVSAAKKDGLTLICVTLNDKNDWNDHKALYEYGYSRLCCLETNDKAFCVEIPCVGGSKNSVIVSGEKNQKLVLPAEDKDKIVRKVYCDSFLYAPIKENQAVGRIDYLIGSKTAASTNLIAMDNVNSITKNKGIFEKIKELFTDG